MRIKPLLFLALALTLVAACAFAVQPDIDRHPGCQLCGMDREMFSHSRMYVEYNDGTSAATCSLHCLAVDLARSIDKTPKMIQVADYRTRQLIDAEKAFWVIGGKVSGVMTGNPTWAFAAKGDAEAFVRENGGAVATYEAALKAAYDEMQTDATRILEKRKMKKHGSDKMK